MRLIKHIRRWNIWRRHNFNSSWYKLLVLFGIRKSPTMTITWLPEEKEKYQKRALAILSTLGYGRSK